MSDRVLESRTRSRIVRVGYAAALGVVLFAGSGCRLVCKLNGTAIATSGIAPSGNAFYAFLDSFWANQCYGKGQYNDGRDFGLYEVYLAADDGTPGGDPAKTGEFKRQVEQCKFASTLSGFQSIRHEWPSSQGPFDQGYTDANLHWCFWENEAVDPAYYAQKYMFFVTRDEFGKWRLEQTRDPLPPPQPTCGGYGQACTNGCCSPLVCMTENANHTPATVHCTANVSQACVCGPFTPLGYGAQCLSNADCASGLCYFNTPTGLIGVCH